MLCELADSPLSSVALNAGGVGYRAAALLDRMMRGRVRKPRRLVAEPLHVVSRRSTDIIAMDDHDIADAVGFIHDHATEGIQVEDVVQHGAISRRNLETRFRCREAWVRVANVSDDAPGHNRLPRSFTLERLTLRRW